MEQVQRLGWVVKCYGNFKRFISCGYQIKFQQIKFNSASTERKQRGHKHKNACDNFKSCWGLFYCPASMTSGFQGNLRKCLRKDEPSRVWLNLKKKNIYIYILLKKFIYHWIRRVPFDIVKCTFVLFSDIVSRKSGKRILNII